MYGSKFQGIPFVAVIAGLEIIMYNNVFKFGDTLWKQINGVAMGQPPSPSFATIYFGIHERKIIPQLINMGVLLHYFRYIDDVFGAWAPSINPTLNNAQWFSFKQAMNTYHGLEWIFSDRKNTVEFLDIKVEIDINGKMHTDLFEKAMNPYLYITPTSSHPPGVLLGLVLGNCYRIYTLVSDEDKIKSHMNTFYKRLLARGYDRNTLLPIFSRAADKERDRKNYDLMLSRASTPKPHQFLFHLRFHPADPKARDIQKIWKDIVDSPPGGHTYASITNNKGYRHGDTKLTVCYRRAPNLGDLLSSKHISNTRGPAVSSFMD